MSEKDEWFDADYEALKFLKKLPKRVKDCKFPKEITNGTIEAIEIVSEFIFSRRVSQGLKRVGAAQDELMKHLGIQQKKLPGGE